MQQFLLTDGWKEYKCMQMKFGCLSFIGWWVGRLTQPEWGYRRAWRHKGHKGGNRRWNGGA